MVLNIDLKNGVRTIVIYNPSKKNALNTDNYEELTNILNEDAKNPEVVITIITGAGEYFTSGNDLTHAMLKIGEESMDDIIMKGFTQFKNMVTAFINYPKLLIAFVNGPNIGIGVTLCALCDITYATERATFMAPFVKLGLCIEGTGSYSFPRILGRSKASEVLLLGEKLNAEDALRLGLISKIVPFNEKDEFITKLLGLGKMNVESLMLNKKLIMDNIRPQLIECHERECKQLFKCQHSDLFIENISKFMNRKSKL